MEVHGRDDPRRYSSQGCIDFPISVPRHQVFDIDIHGDADPECELNFPARSLESTCPEEMSMEGKMEGKNSQAEKQSHDTEMTFMHTDMGTMTVSSHVAELASSGDLPMSASTPASTGDYKEHATDGDSFQRSHCASPARAVGHTLHSAPSLRHTTSNCRMATSATTDRSSAKDLNRLVDSVSRYVSLPVSSCSNAAAALFVLLAPVYMFVLFPGCFPLLCKLPAFFLLCKLPVHLRLVVCVALCDICYMNTSLNVLLYWQELPSRLARLANLHQVLPFFLPFFFFSIHFFCLFN
jgi:hypothetical protein